MPGNIGHHGSQRRSRKYLYQRLPPEAFQSPDSGRQYSLDLLDTHGEHGQQQDLAHMTGARANGAEHPNRQGFIEYRRPEEQHEIDRGNRYQ